MVDGKPVNWKSLKEWTDFVSKHFDDEEPIEEVSINVCRAILKYRNFCKKLLKHYSDEMALISGETPEHYDKNNFLNLTVKEIEELRELTNE